MKAIAIIEVPEGGKGKWYIDGEIRYTENESLIEKFDNEMIPLKPLPKHKYGFEADGLKPSNQILIQSGWNACLDEITGETE